MNVIASSTAPNQSHCEGSVSGLQFAHLAADDIAPVTRAANGAGGVNDVVI
jgi:hypothetical protein